MAMATNETSEEMPSSPVEAETGQKDQQSAATGDAEEGRVNVDKVQLSGNNDFDRSSESLGEMEDCHLTPLIDGSRLSLHAPISAPPLSTNGHEKDQHNSHSFAPHREQYPRHNIPQRKQGPQDRDTVPGSPGPTADRASTRARSTRRRTRNARGTLGSGERHSNPRKSPYRSEVARRRHAREAGGTTGATDVSLRSTTAPPDTALFSYQASRLQRSAPLHALGEFLAEPFADEPDGTEQRQDPPRSHNASQRLAGKGHGNADGYSFANLKHALSELISPRATDIQQLLVKLDDQFQMLSLDLEQYALERCSSSECTQFNLVGFLCEFWPPHVDVLLIIK